MPIRTKTWAQDAEGRPLVVDIEPDLRFPVLIEAVVNDEPDLEEDLRMVIVFDLWLERYVVDSLEVRRRADGAEVAGTSLRSVRVHDLLRRAVRQSLQLGQINDRSPIFGVEYELAAEDAATVRSWGPSSDDALRWVARIYKFAQALNDAPLQAVQQQIGIAVPTASVWIRRARDRGILRPTPAPPPGEAARLFDAARATIGAGGWRG